MAAPERTVARPHRGEPTQRVRQLLAAARASALERTDHAFAALLLGQAAALLAMIARSGVPATALTGVVMSAVVVPVTALAALAAGRPLTRHAVAAAQMLCVAGFIHLSDGALEAHLYAFASIALLAFYRDWRVLLTGSAVALADHVFRSLWFPSHLFTVVATDAGQWAEYAVWLALESGTLTALVCRSQRELRAVATRQVRVERLNARLESTAGELRAALKRVEAERREKQSLLEELEALSDSMSDGVLVLDPAGHPTHLNPEARRMLGALDAEQPLDAALLGLLEDDQSSPVASADDPFRSGRGVVETPRDHYLSPRPGREASWVNVSVRPLRGSRRGSAVVLRDVTERRRVEQLKNEFVSTVSHELRTPLTSISGSLELILGGLTGPLPEQTRGLLEIASRNAERLVRLISDLLDVEKLSSGRMEVRCEDMSLLPVVERTLAANQGFAARCGVTLELATDAAALRVHANPDRVEQVLTNLVSNACKFSPPGERVRVRVEAAEDGGALVSVADQGPGIPASFVPRMFQPFSQADGTVTRRQGGTGLGLSICKALIERMQGAIGFTSQEGEGSTFRFTLPASGAEEAPTTDDDTQEALAAPSLAALQVLLFEADAELAGVIRTRLEAAGFACDVALDPTRCRELLEQHVHQVVILEPDQDGLQLLQQALSDRQEPLPVLFLNAEPDALAAAEPWRGLVNRLARVANSAQRAVPRVLHVEDDEDLAQVVAAQLGDDVRLVHARTRNEAQMLLEQGGAFDLALLDVGLPDGSGLDLLPQLQRRGVPAIVFSARELGADVQSRVRAALVKSNTTTRQLLEAVRGVLAETRQPATC